MKANKVYEFVNPRQRDIKINIGKKREIEDEMNRWIKNQVPALPNLSYKINEDYTVTILQNLPIESITYSISYFPDFVTKINGILRLVNNSKIRQLPDDFTVDRILSIKHAINIKTLPENLTILQDKDKHIRSVLNIIGTNIQTIPESLNVYIIYTDNEELLKKIREEGKYRVVYSTK